MEPMNLFVSPDLVKSAQEMSNPLLKVPDHAVSGRGDAKRWTERLVIQEASAEPVTNEKGEVTDRVALRLRFKVAPTSTDRTNVNRSTRASYLINLKAVDGTGERIMTDISLGRVHGLLRALNYSIGEAGFNLGDYFCPASPLINAEVNAVVMDKPDRNNPSERRQDIGNFTMVTD